MTPSSDIGEWLDIGEWWDAFSRTHSLGQSEKPDLILNQRLIEGAWSDLDPWWESYTEVRRSDIAELRDLLETFDDIFQRTTNFECDPLSADWSPHQDTRGPLRTNKEENWSQWLAHLLRSGSATFSRAIFGDDFEITPDNVRREVHFSEYDGADRRVDILAGYPEGGLSIEVKTDNEQYEKTRHTVELIERHRGGNWQHRLLLPEYKLSSLREAFEEELDEGDDGVPQIRSERSEPISVLHWRDVSIAIREVLLEDNSVSSHWGASAYLFASLIEQKLLDFNPTPVVENIADSDDVIHASRSLSVATGDLGDQIRYLEDILDELSIDDSSATLG